MYMTNVYLFYMQRWAMLMLLLSSMVLPKRVVRSLPCGRERLQEEEA
jgi:hypothetical protein